MPLAAMVVHSAAAAAPPVLTPGLRNTTALAPSKGRYVTSHGGTLWPCPLDCTRVEGRVLCRCQRTRARALRHVGMRAGSAYLCVRVVHEIPNELLGRHHWRAWLLRVAVGQPPMIEETRKDAARHQRKGLSKLGGELDDRISGLVWVHAHHGGTCPNLSRSSGMLGRVAAPDVRGETHLQRVWHAFALAKRQVRTTRGAGHAQEHEVSAASSLARSFVRTAPCARASAHLCAPTGLDCLVLQL